MKVDTIIKWFMPKEERFHDLLLKDTQNLVEATRIFAEIASSASLEERRVKTVQLKAVEHDGDQLTRQIFEALNSTFITPLDREDLRVIASDLDDILDLVEGVAQSLVMYELSESSILVNMAQEIDKATGLIWDLSNEKTIQASLMRISELENQGDTLYSTVMADLFKSGRNPIEILKWKEIFQGLEDACDGCKDYTHALGNVVIKNA